MSAVHRTAATDDGTAHAFAAVREGVAYPVSAV